MVHQERLATGEKWFVFGTLLALAVEGVLAIIHNALFLTWPGLILGVGGFCFVMYLANRLYAGDRNAYNLALVWVGFQFVYAVLVLGLMVSSEQGAATARSLGAPVIWGALLKGVAYAIFGTVLLRIPEVQDFLADKRGEAPKSIAGPDVSATSAPTAAPTPTVSVELSAEANESVQDLASYMRKASGILVALGAFQLLAGVLKYDLEKLNSWLGLAEGAILIALGVLISGPARQIGWFADKANQNSTELGNTLCGLACHFKAQSAAVLVLVAVWVARCFIA